MLTSLALHESVGNRIVIANQVPAKSPGQWQIGRDLHDLFPRGRIHTKRTPRIIGQKTLEFAGRRDGVSATANLHATDILASKGTGPHEYLRGHVVLALQAYKEVSEHGERDLPLVTKLDVVANQPFFRSQRLPSESRVYFAPDAYDSIDRFTGTLSAASPHIDKHREQHGNFQYIDLLQLAADGLAPYVGSSTEEVLGGMADMLDVDSWDGVVLAWAGAMEYSAPIDAARYMLHQLATLQSAAEN